MGCQTLTVLAMCNHLCSVPVASNAPSRLAATHLDNQSKVDELVVRVLP